MDNYDMHGGHFAPQGLLKINEGGSHEENPNGGVQLGVDQQGIPNLVEEDEVVYNDFVYSDNIKADEEFLSQFNIPAKYAGKLYSDIAEAFCDDADEQTDPITLKGLDAMLGRLAQAQEAQKAAEEQKALEEELSNMSPEEIAALEQLLAEQEAQQQPMIPEEQVQSEVMPEQIAPEQIAPEQVMPEAPMMAMGGPINTFDGGGRSGNIFHQTLPWYLNQAASLLSPIETKEITLPDGTVTQMQYATPPAITAKDIDMWKNTVNRLTPVVDKLKKEHGFFAPFGNVDYRDLNIAKRNLKRAERAAKKAVDTAQKTASVVKETAPAAKEAAKSTSKVGSFIKKNWKWAVPVAGITTADALGYGPVSGVKNIIENRSYSGEDIQPYDLSGAIPYGYANGGSVNRYDWGDFMNRLNNYHVSENRGGVDGRYKIDAQFPHGYRNILAYEQSEPYKNFTNYVLGHSDEPEIQNYLRALDAGTHSSVDKLFDGDNLREGWQELYNQRRNDQKGGIYHFNPDEIPGFMVGADPNDMTDDVALDEIINSPVDTYIPGFVNERPVSIDNPDVFVPGLSKDLLRKARRDARTPAGFDWRYLAPLTDAAMGLATASTPPDHYDYQSIRPYQPYGYIRQQYERYNPLDINMVTNQMQAQAQANMRALRNAGIGPATGANMIASDYAAGQNYGNALTNVWDAKNQHRNQVITQNNHADAMTANFDWGVEAARANAINQPLPYNQRMALTVQQMNNEAEQQKFNALSGYINSAKDFFNAKGREDLSRNMVNTNRGMLGYGIDRYNNVVYDKNGNPLFLVACGGKLKK